MAEDGQSKALLLGFFRRVKSLADEIRERQADITDVCKEARSAGFDSTKIREVERWVAKIEKHGREKVDEAEAIFDLYRSVVDGGAVKLDELMDSARDRALLKMFAPDDQAETKLTKRTQQARTALAMAAAAKAARAS